MSVSYCTSEGDVTLRGGGLARRVLYCNRTISERLLNYKHRKACARGVRVHSFGCLELGGSCWPRFWFPGLKIGAFVGKDPILPLKKCAGSICGHGSAGAGDVHFM